MASGRPIITNGVGEVKNYIDNYPSIFYHCLNKVDYFNAINDIKINYKEKKFNLHKIREVALENSWDNRAKSLIKFYKNICDN